METESRKQQRLHQQLNRIYLAHAAVPVPVLVLVLVRMLVLVLVLVVLAPVVLQKLDHLASVLALVPLGQRWLVVRGHAAHAPLRTQHCPSPALHVIRSKPISTLTSSMAPQPAAAELLLLLLLPLQLSLMRRLRLCLLGMALHTSTHRCGTRCSMAQMPALPKRRIFGLAAQTRCSPG